jgi:non-ribosomal peptide synthetase-like protein
VFSEVNYHPHLDDYVGNMWAFAISLYQPSMWPILVLFSAIGILLYPLIIGFAVCQAWLIKRIMIGIIEAEDVPLKSLAYYRYWLNSRVCAIVYWAVGISKGGSGGPLMPFILNFMGSNVARNVVIFGEVEPGCAELLNLGEGVYINAGAWVQTSTLEHRVLKLRPVTIQKDCYVGEISLVAAGSVLAERTILHPGTILPHACVSQPNSIWHGSPAEQIFGTSKLVQAIHELHQQPPNTGWSTWCVYLRQLFMGVLLSTVNTPTAIMSVFLAAPLGFITLPVFGMYPDLMPITWALLVAWPLVVCKILNTLISVWLGRMAVHCICAPTPQDEVVKMGSWAHIAALYSHTRNVAFFKNVLTRGWKETLTIGSVLNCVYGFKIGKGTEIDEGYYFSEKSISIGENSMINGGGQIGFPIIANGYLMTSSACVADKVVTGNMQCIPNGSTLSSGSLLGMQTSSPVNEVVPCDTVIFGSPAVVMPPTPTSAADLSLTYEPPWNMKLLRHFTEVIKVTLAPTLFYVVGTLSLYIGVWTAMQPGIRNVTSGVFAMWPSLATMLVTTTLSGVFLLFVTTVGLKWLIAGRYREQIVPLYSIRMFALSVTYEMELLFDEFFMKPLDGTPVVNSCFRALGAAIGKNCVLIKSKIHEADLATIGDDCVIFKATLATHLFENRMLNLGPIVMEQGCLLGEKSVIQKNCHLGARTTLGPGTLLVQNESTIDDATFIGHMAEPVVLNKDMTIVPDDRLRRQRPSTQTSCSKLGTLHQGPGESSLVAVSSPFA